MQQLVELQKHAETFQRLNTEVVFVFREESLGVDGLKKMKVKHKTTFTLALDNQKKKSSSSAEGGCLASITWRTK